MLDLTHQVPKELAHGVSVPIILANSGPPALAGVLQRWVQHMAGLALTITPLACIDDDAWRWHGGLDVESTAILNDLYTVARRWTRHGRRG